ncbi:DNA polymerase IV [Leifsonia sp. Root4]|uniref:DNA polymerase IV n=1 Tax=Leifsonia sp. Root4 TaxID=1736525 RepID=UPI0006FC861A|nr:DNA polymerase IV [Leifsonia sp. Root4]KQW03557.1 DNA polymerase IV [Leifsonia sp. Root4]
MSKQDGSTRQVSAPGADDSRTPFLHVDLDAFFASVELLDNPELAGKPVVVGGRGPRSVVSAANYEARRYGVNSAMPMALALRRCPNAVVVPVRMHRYAELSAQVMAIFDDMTPLVERLGIDEAFLDVSGAAKLLGSPRVVAELLRARVLAETGLTCSVGVASTKFVAKLASGRSKPNGLLVVPAEQTLAFLHPLPVSALWGVGAATEAQLKKLGLNRVADVAETPLGVLQSTLGPALGLKLHSLANGLDPRAISTEREEKSIGHETTFSYDITDIREIRRALLRQSDDVAARLRRAELVARTVVLKLRYSDFSTVTKSRTLAEPTNVGRRIYEEALAAFDALGAAGTRVRLIGVRAEQLGVGGGSLGLWDPDEEWREAELAVDEVTARFGKGMLKPAALVRSPPEG